MLRTVFLLLVVTGIHGPLAFADEPAGHDHAPASGESIEEVRVTAHPFSETDEHIVRPVQVLSKEELQTRSISNLGETVANEPGIASSDYGTGAGRPVIRGQSGNRVQILENGLSTMDLGAFSADHSVTTETVLSQQIEIFSGPATLLFGSAASGGIINVVTDRILDYVPDELEGEVALQYETVSDGMTGAGRLNFGAGNFAFHIDGMTRDMDDYNIPGFAELEPGESIRGTLANSNRKTDQISGGLSWVGARGYAGFSVSRYENEYGLPGHHHHHGDEHDHGHGPVDMHLHDDDDDHDHDEEDEHHDDEDGDHDHDDEEGDHDHDEDEHHDDEEGDHDHDEDEHHDDEEGDHDHDEDEHHDDEEGDHDHDEDEHHDDEDMDHHDDEDEHHDDDDMDHHDDEDEHHDDDDMDHHDDEDEHHDDDDMDHHDDEDEHHDDEDEHHDDEDGDHGHDDEDGHGHDEEDEHADEEEGGARIEMEQTRYDFVAALDDPLPGLSRVKLRLGYNDYKHVEGEESAGTVFDNEEVEGRVELLHNPIGGWFGVVGVHYRHQDFTAVGAESFVPPSELESFGVFILEKTDIGRVHIELGARYEHQDSDAETGDKNSYDLFSASGGLNWDYAPGYQFGLSVSHSERAPALGELYALGPHLATTTFEIGDTGLDKEKSNNIDIYWRKTAGKFTVSANFFYNRIDDYIYKQEQDLNGDGFADRVTENFDGDPANILAPGVDEELFLIYMSQDDAEFMGFEAETRARLMDTDQGRMVLRLWADYVEGERSNDINLPRITPWRFGSGLTYSRGDFYSTVNYTRVNEQDSTAPLETETGGYHLLDIQADYRFRMGGNTVTLFARASNLLDEEIRRHVSFVKDQAPLPGRSGIFGMRVAF